LEILNGLIQFTLFLMVEFNSKVEPPLGTDCARLSRVHCISNLFRRWSRQLLCHISTTCSLINCLQAHYNRSNSMLREQESKHVVWKLRYVGMWHRPIRQLGTSVSWESHPTIFRVEVVFHPENEGNVFFEKFSGHVSNCTGSHPRKLIADVTTVLMTCHGWCHRLHLVHADQKYRVIKIRLPWLRFFRAFSSVVRQIPGLFSQRRGTVSTLPS
jgi:hypothetical protein